MIDKSYIIATISRSGSSYFDNLLKRYGYGFPHEVREGDSKEFCLSNAKQIFPDGTHVYAFKTKRYILMRYKPIDFSPKGDLPNPVYIRVQRLNKIAQSVSKYIQSYQATHGKNIEVPYDFEAIDKIMRRNIRFEEDIDNFFLDNNISPLQVFYEELWEDTNLVMKQVSEFLGHKPKISNSRLAYKFIRNARNKPPTIALENRLTTLFKIDLTKGTYD